MRPRPRANEDMTKLGGAESRITMSRSRKVSCANWAHCCGDGEEVSLGHSLNRQWYENARRRELPTPQKSKRLPNADAKKL